ncbi:MAG: cation transporter, partial [Deltaproteobacteria bacterium]|nr:cation transporter [Deltaproteobacteria bacterium]
MAERGGRSSGADADRQAEAREKHSVAASSVAAAVLLTGGKLIVGVLSGSLGILSEALHSGLDLVAAVVTWVAVRASGRPADEAYSYGHGKVENVSALFETLLLLVTCVWIIYEAVERLTGKSVEVEVSFWAFLVMGVSIVVDFSRSRALSRVAKKYNSQALEADALHFSTDIWSSGVVILGLVLVLVSELTGVQWLAQADSVAALGVAAIVVVVSLKLGRRALGALMDEAPPGLIARLEEHCRVRGIDGIRRFRVRMSGPQGFVDVALSVPAGTTLPQGHDIADRVERVVQEVVPGADVLVHVEPERDGGSCDLLTVRAIRDLAAEKGLPAHNIRITRLF